MFFVEYPSCLPTELVQLSYIHQELISDLGHGDAEWQFQKPQEKRMSSHTGPGGFLIPSPSKMTEKSQLLKNARLGKE